MLRQKSNRGPGSAAHYFVLRCARDTRDYVFTGVSGTGVSGPLPANHEMMLSATS